MSTDELSVERRDAVVVLRLNRPDARNALTPSLMHALGAAVLSAEADDDVRAVVLTGAGDRAFCAGLDLRSFAAGEVEADETSEGQAFQRLLHGRVEVPMVGAANGAAVAGGFELLLGCDLIVLAEHATLGLPEVKRGLVAGGSGLFVGERVALSVALELTLTGDPLEARRAFELGLANAVVPAVEVLDVALDYARRIAANGPLAVRATKEIVRLAASDATAARKRLGEWQPEVFASDDAREGAVAFLEKRDPVWKGR